MSVWAGRGARVHLRDHGAQQAGGKMYDSHSNVRKAWVNHDGPHNLYSQQRNENSMVRSVLETRSQLISQPITTELAMDVDQSDHMHRDTMKMKNTEELFLKLEDILPLIQNSKQEMVALKQSLTTKVSEETLKLKEEIERLTMENQALRARDHNRASHKTDEDKLKKLEQELREAKKLNDEYTKTYSEVCQKYEEMVAKIKPLEQTVADHKLNMGQMTDECESLKMKLSTLQHHYQEVNNEKTRIEKELAESKTRLSRLMGNKLGDNNPDIADLSDKNRPTKLAEKNTELYDNEWTDAYEVFQTHYSTEKETIEKLLQMLHDIKAACDKLAKEQEVKLKEAMKLKASGDGLPDHVFKQLKDFRRFTAEESLPEVIQICLKTVRYKEYGRYLRDEDVLKFFKGCVELCWFMNVQDPPLVFGDTPRKNELFDSNTFKFYTATGSHYDYMVWPALFLTKDGALLSKGVAQASKVQYSVSHRHRNNETERNNARSAANVHGLDHMTRQNAGRHSDTDTTTTHLSHDIDRFFANHESGNVYHKNYEQFPVAGSDYPTDKTGFNQTTKERGITTVASRLDRNFGGSERRGESDNSKRRIPKPSVPIYWENFKRISSIYGIDSPETISILGKYYDNCKDYYIYLRDNDTSESNV